MKSILGLSGLFICLGARVAQPQGVSNMLSGVVTDAARSPVAGATVAAKNTVSSESSETRSDPSGHYAFTALPSGTYDVTVSAAGFSAKQMSVSLATGASRTLDVALERANGAVPSLGDLGFPTPATQGSSANQALLDRRSHMLQVHQRLGLITAAPLVASLISSGGAGGRSTSSSTRDLHAALGSLTLGMYVWTASYAIRAPRIEGTPTRGPIRLHKALAWVHGTGMILTPALGIMAFDQKSKGERVHGIASAHGAAAWTTAIAYGAAIASVSFKF